MKTNTTKRKACDRDQYSIKENRTSTSVIMSAVTFEQFRSYIDQYLRSKNYETRITIVPDQTGANTNDIIRVFLNGKHTYTMNLYTTTSSILVNGPQYKKFIEEDIPVVLEKIDDITDELTDHSCYKA